MDVEKLRQQLQEYGQEHLLQFWPQLDEDERQELVRSIQEYVSIDFQIHGNCIEIMWIYANF